MENPLAAYLKTAKISMADFARILKVRDSSIFQWSHGKVCPRPEMAWKIYKKTKGDVPLSFWGYEWVGGKIRKILDKPLKHGGFNPKPYDSLVENG